MIDIAKALYRICKADDLERAHWLATPDAWIKIRKEKDSLAIVEFTGPATQKMLGIPLRIGKVGTQPALDLIIE